LARAKNSRFGSESRARINGAADSRMRFCPERTAMPWLGRQAGPYICVASSAINAASSGGVGRSYRGQKVLKLRGNSR
jgi:hypothetical protein